MCGRLPRVSIPRCARVLAVACLLLANTTGCGGGQVQITQAPPVDPDGDGVAGNADQCPDTPEDRDNFEDDDGCPDADNDADGMLDIHDRCPQEAEDPDGFVDEDGCPDVDNDRDGIPDVNDRCPCQAETYNDLEDEDGCADGSMVLLIDNRITIRDQVFFRVNRAYIPAEAEALLDALVDVMRAHPEVHHVVVQGHAAPGEHRPQQLALARAEAVHARLISLGVEPARLGFAAFSDDQPIHPTEQDRNRRVEFHVDAADEPPPNIRQTDPKFDCP